MTDVPSNPGASQFRPSPRSRAGLLVGVFVLELLVLAAAYQFVARIECQATAAQGACDFLRSLVARALVVLAAAAVLIRARPQAFSRFLQSAAAHRPRFWPTLHLAGVAALFFPLALAGGADLAPMFHLAAIPWVLGGLAAALGGLFWLAPPRAWGALLSQDSYAPVPILLAAALLPDFANLALPVWDSHGLTRLTYDAVWLFLSAFSDTAFADPATYVIGVQDFAVHIARQCSGVEGFALVTGFITLYAFIFRHELRPLRFFALMLPLGIALSWLLNVVRIGVLILLGAHGSPDLAVNGFHSYAGWLFFTLLALGLVVLVQLTPWLHRRGQVAPPPGPPLHRDPVAAAILPFVVFMLASTLVAALAPHPELGYPVKALALLLAVLPFWPVWRNLGWQPDPVAMGAGAVVGLLWVLTAGPPDDELRRLLASMGAGALASWIALRLMGTVVLVPLVEEMLFRGYLQRRLDGPALPRRIAAIAISAGLFALLHGRWVEAFAAGVVFSLVMLRTGRTGSAVQAHVAANLMVALAALAQGDFSLI